MVEPLRSGLPSRPQWNIFVRPFFSFFLPPLRSGLPSRPQWNIFVRPFFSFFLPFLKQKYYCIGSVGLTLGLLSGLTTKKQFFFVCLPYINLNKLGIGSVTIMNFYAKHSQPPKGSCKKSYFLNGSAIWGLAINKRITFFFYFFHYVAI